MICKDCNIDLDDKDFPSRLGRVHGLMCIQCKNIRRKARYNSRKSIINAERRRYYISNKQKLNSDRRLKYQTSNNDIINSNRMKKYHLKKDQINKARRDQYQSDSSYRQKILAGAKIYATNNKPKIKARDEAYRNRNNKRDQIEIPLDNICCICNILQPSENFHFDKSRKTGLSNKCKSCTIKAYSKYRSKNRAKILASTKLARIKDPIRFKSYDVRRRQLETNCIQNIKTWHWEFIKYLSDYKCLCCSTKESEENVLTVDHIIPLSKGGNDTYDNVQPLCKSCNSKKHTSIIDFRTENILTFFLNKVGVSSDY